MIMNKKEKNHLASEIFILSCLSILQVIFVLMGLFAIYLGIKYGFNTPISISLSI